MKRKGVDYLLIANPVVHLTTRGSVSTVRALLQACRLEIVLTKNRYLCPPDKEHRLETCEIEVQGWGLQYSYYASQAFIRLQRK